jgi:glyoxylase-like metal-dependent hydrolase (beta-lactamase superfamily II)
MTEQILPGLYRLEIPIPDSPLKATNAYLIKSDTRNLLVDTGQNTPKSLEVMQAGLAGLSIDLSRTDIILTHMHADHSRLVPELITKTSTLYATAADAESVNSLLMNSSLGEWLYSAALRNGLPHEDALAASKRHPANSGAIQEPLRFTIIAEGAVISAGNYHFTCIETPGHTKGHLCLYENDKRILLSGDHILGDISPNITNFRGDVNPLKDFMNSLKKIEALPVKLVLPGHRRIFSDCAGRISQLLEHHRRRINEVLSIVNDEPMTAYQVASRMTWDMVYNSWDDVVPAQKFFATGEALSHLRFLECEGKVQCDTAGNIGVYRRSP